MTKDEISAIMQDLEELHQRLVLNYNDGVPFEQFEEDRLTVANAIELVEFLQEEIKKREAQLVVNEWKEVPMRDERIYRVGWKTAFVEEIKDEAIKEFAEKLKTRIKEAVSCCYDVRFKNHLQELLRIIVAKIDNLVAERVGNYEQDKCFGKKKYRNKEMGV